MNITKTDTGFQFEAASLPAPITLSAAVAKAFAEALVSDDIQNPVAAFGAIDKLVWSPQTREPLGLWVTGEAKIQLWIAGATSDLTTDEARALAETILLADADYQVGDEVEIVPGYDLATYENGEPNEPRVKVHGSGTLGTIAEVYYAERTIRYKVDLGDGNGILAPNVLPVCLKRPDPLQYWEVIEAGRIYVSRSTTVQARNKAEATKLAKAEFQAMGAQKGWGDGLVETDGIEEVIDLGESLQAFDEVNATEGFVVTPENGVVAVDGGFNNSNEAAYRFVVEQALAGSPRHRLALRMATKL